MPSNFLQLAGNQFRLIAAVLLLVGSSALGQVIIADGYNVAASGTGFALNTGVNAGINPPTTRLTGTSAPGLRYFQTATTKTNTAFAIASNKLRVTSAANPGRFTLSANGATAFDFSGALGSLSATPQRPVVYELAISMANNSAGSQRFSFALGSTEGDASTWDFGVQIYRPSSTDNFYAIGKRIDTGSSGLTNDLNEAVANTAADTYGKEITILMRVTDAGAETSGFNSRVQLSMDGGFTWFYDTKYDSDLRNGWRLNGPGRYIMWDVAPDAGNVTYDNFSVRPVPVSATLISPQANAVNLGAFPNLKVAVSNAAPGSVTVSFFGREAPTVYPGRDFSIAVLPDTQNYAREASDNGEPVKEIWFAQTDWIVTNRVKRNIAYVAHLGDIVQNGDLKLGNQNATEWRIATNAMYRLEDPVRTLLKHGIPYGCALGNHDEEPIGNADGGSSFYNKYFGVSHFKAKPYYGGHYGSNNNNHFDLFSAGGLDWIVLYFGYDETQDAAILDWADSVLETNQHRRAIVVTHYAGSDTTPSNFSAQGAAIYNGLKGQTNFFMMLGGHVASNGGEGSRTNIYQGRTVRTFISDFQGWMNGGNGNMRMIYFSPSNNLVKIETYSPWLDQYHRDSNSEMSFPYNMLPSGADGSSYDLLAENEGVAPGSQTSCAWAGLQPNTSYEWYVRVTDAAGNSAVSSIWRFTTGNNTAPVVTNQALTVTGDQPVSMTLFASDINGDSIVFSTNSLPTHGLITDFDPETGVLSYVPARGYRGLDQFGFQANDSAASSALAILTLNVIAPPDTNSNGLPDLWETIYGITDPYADSDGDGQSNLAEYLANTNPTNALSLLNISSPIIEGGAVTLIWPSVGGTRYRVQCSDGDVNGGVSGIFTDIVRNLFSEMDSSPFGSDSTQSFTDTLSQTNRARYYRVRVTP